MNRQRLKTDRVTNNKDIQEATEQVTEKTKLGSPAKKKVLKASVSVASTAPSSMGRTQSKWLTSLARQNFIYFAEKLE